MLEWMTSGLFVLICCGIQWTSQPISHPDPTNNPPASACNLIVDAGPDTNVCAPGGTIGLMGSVTGNAIYYYWTPASGLNNAFILNPTANVTGPVTYTLRAYGVDPNNPQLVVNGNFSGGNTGFNSDYNYVVDLPNVQNEMVPEGTYAVIPNPNLVHTGFSACNDHTGGGGNMMVINGAANLQDIWCQTVAVSPNSYYNVSAWVASVNPSSPAQLQFSINNVPIGSIINAVPSPCTWTPFNAVWNSGSSTTATICILNLNTAQGGNDFALDDISMVGLCVVEDEVEITLVNEQAPVPDIDGPTFLCEGETGTYTASFPPDPEILSFDWSVPSGAIITSGQGTPEVTVLWQDAQEDEICLDIETRCDENSACFDVVVGTVPALPLISGPSTLCPGETTTLYTPELDPDDTFEWIVPSQVSIISGEGTNEIEVEWASAGDAEICVEVTNECGTTDNCTLLTLLPSYLILFDTVICEGTTFEINGTTYGNGLFSGTEYFVTEAGCDSIVEVEVTEAASLEYMFTESICPGDSLFIGGAYQTQAGTYADTFTTVSGCDSLVITQLILSPFDTTWIFATSCNPADTGATAITISMGGCDSTVITQVTLLPTDTTIVTIFSCNPADTSHTSLLFTNRFGCDSLVYTNILLSPTDTTNIFQSTCDPAQVGVTEQALTNIYGCDSLVVTTVSYLQSDTTLINVRTCFIADTGTTSTLLINSKGCDSLVVVMTAYAGSDTTYLSSTTCVPQDSGTAIYTLLNQFGCDSILAVHTILLPTDTTYLSATTCEPLDTGTTNLLLNNVFGCDSLIVLHTILDPANLCDIEANLTVTQPLCYGDAGLVNVTATIGLSPFSVIWENTSTIVKDSAIIIISPGNVMISLSTPGTYSFEIRSANGLSLLDTVSIDDIAPLVVTATTQIDMFGYSITCAGDATGTASAVLDSPGTPPYAYAWSDNSGVPQLNGLTAGIYSVTVTDSHGCTSTSSVTLTEPLPMQYQITTEDILCFGQQNGDVIISNTTGGVQPWSTSLNSGPFQNILAYTDLSAGNHDLVIKDRNGCTFNEQFAINEPDDWSIDLGPDTLIAYGTAYPLAVTIHGQPTGTLQAVWSDGQCDDCLSRTIVPGAVSKYTVTVTDENGCTHTDDLHIAVFIDRDLYVPNIFSPNGDQINDYFTITSGTGLKEIEELTIFDRWGNLVYQQFHFQADDQTASWDGSMNGKILNPGVYVYKLKVIYIDDRQEMRYGDITLIR